MTEQDTHGEQKRDSERQDLDLRIQCRVAGRPVFVSVRDVSESGCRLEGLPGWGEVGNRVVLKIGTFTAPPGIIRWVENRVAGVAFEGRLHPSVVDVVTAHHGKTE